jgi:hypothetical protein
MWMGGNIPLGYDIKDRKLVINAAEAETIRTIFGLYAQHGTVRKVKAAIDELGLRTKARASGAPHRVHDGLPFRLGHLYTILRNPIYVGQVHHKGQTYPGDHQGIVGQQLWDQAQQQLALNAVKHRSGTSSREPSLLAGLIYDHGGKRMTASHAAKDGKRYRYYISNSLIAGRDAKPPNGHRIPAHEIEEHIVTAVCKFLADARRLTDQLCTHNEAPEVMTAIIRRADELGQALVETNSDRHMAIRELISTVHITEDGIRLALNRQALERRLEMTGGAQRAREGHAERETAIVFDIPAKLRRLGKEMRLIVAAHAPETRQDASLIKAVVRAHRWFAMLKSRKASSISDIARTEKLPRTYIGSLIPLAFLAPDITEAILGGRQPIDVTLDRILKLSPLPLDWPTQRQALATKAP